MSKIIRMTTLLCIFAISQAAVAAELVHQFSSPAFSGAGYSAHVLTIEQLEAQRRQKIKDEKQAAVDKAERDAKNTTLAKFIVNLEIDLLALAATDELAAQNKTALGNAFEKNILPNYNPATSIQYYFNDDKSRITLTRRPDHIAEVTVGTEQNAVININQGGVAVKQQVNSGGTTVITIVQK